MLISKMAKLAGCHVETIRYYESIGLLPRATRAANGYRNYTTKDLNQLKLIRKLKHLGFSQKEIREMILLTYSKSNPCKKVHQLTTKHLERVNNKIKEYRAIKRTLEKMCAECESEDYKYCPTLSKLAEDQ